MITKSCPQPAEKQKWYHNPQKTKASICFHKHKKGPLQPRSVMAPERGNPFISGFFSPLSCVSRQQNYRLDVARGNKIDTHFHCRFANRAPGTYPLIFADFSVSGNISTSWNLLLNLTFLPFSHIHN